MNPKYQGSTPGPLAQAIARRLFPNGNPFATYCWDEEARNEAARESYRTMIANSVEEVIREHDSPELARQNAELRRALEKITAREAAGCDTRSAILEARATLENCPEL